MRKNCKGNVLVYILMAVALLAALTYMISRDGGGQQTNQLSEAEANLRASEIISLAASVRMAVDQMNQWGVKYEDIRFWF